MIKIKTVAFDPSAAADIHTHVLPGMDDGSKSVEMTEKMLSAIYESGIRSVVATPHYNAAKESPDEFLARRKAAVEKVRPILSGENMPRLFVGAEVAFINGISHVTGIDKLRIEGTDFILIEMPFRSWGEAEAREALDFFSLGLTPIFAHTERYLSFTPKKIWESFAENGAVLQSNAEFLIRQPFTSSRRIRKGLVHVLASDCHNLTDRAPNLLEGLKAAARTGDEMFFGELEYNYAEILKNAAPVI